MAQNDEIFELKGFGSVRFFFGKAAKWATSGKLLKVNEYAIITDEPYHYKQGIGVSSINVPGAATGVPFSQLPYYTASGSYTYENAIVAFATGGQGSATPLTAEFNEVGTVATAGDSVLLLPAQAGLSQTVTNVGAHSLAVFPATGDAINGQAVNTSFPLAPGQSKTFLATDNTNWAIHNSPIYTPLQPAAINATATATAPQVASKLITSTSGAATSITLPTVALLAAYLGAKLGLEFDFWVDNTLGANTVTMVLGTGMTALTVITGENTLTIAAGSAGKFKLYFKSGTAALIARVA